MGISFGLGYKYKSYLDYTQLLGSTGKTRCSRSRCCWRCCYCLHCTKCSLTLTQVGHVDSDTVGILAGSGVLFEVAVDVDTVVVVETE